MQTPETDQSANPAPTIKINDPAFILRNEQFCKNMQSKIAVFNAEINAPAAAESLRLKTYITFEFDEGP